MKRLKSTLAKAAVVVVLAAEVNPP